VSYLSASRPKWAIALFLALFFAAVTVRDAQAGFIVPGDSNIYGAGHSTAPAPGGNGGGSLPPSITVSGNGHLTFQVSGQVSYNNGGNYYGADGGVFLGSVTDMDAYGGLSGIQDATNAFFLVGVFLNDQEPSGTPPPTLDFTDNSFATLSPELNQLFFIGDGLTATGTGSEQQFYIPEGATRLFFGFADGDNFTGLPGTYNDDIGSLNVSYRMTPVPEPSSLTLLASAGVLGLLCYCRRRTCVCPWLFR
jgi:hypothetical protein